MRFSKRVKIGKGVNMNLSKSGASMSFGGPGLSMNYGKNGLYLNTGIPGTGLSHRQKIGTRRKTYRDDSESITKVDTKISIEVKLDDNNSPLIYWNRDQNLPNGVRAKKGEIIKNSEVLYEIKRNPVYKELLKEAAKEKAEEINLRTKILTEIFRKSPKIITTEELIDKLNDIRSPNYLNKIEGLKEPKVEESRRDLELEAKKKIKSLLFWRNKRNREKFVESRLEEYHGERVKRWKYNLAEAQKNLQLIIERIELSLKGDTRFISESFKKFLEDTELPVDFYVDYDFSATERTMRVDLDLPEIEDLPTQKAILTSTSKLSVRNKTQKQLKEEYARCAIGLGFYLACNIFNLSPSIEIIDLSGYTQRISKKTGKEEDQYVYSVRFNRETIAKINMDMIEPTESIKNFHHRIDLTKTYQLREIEPLF